jgi:hypothetical protein
MVIRILFIIAGVVAVMIGSQAPWGEVNAGDITIPLTFFLDIGAIGSVISVIGVALGGLSLSDRLSERSVGLLFVLFGLGIAIGSGTLMTLIDQNHLEVDPGLQIQVNSVDLGPGGFVTAAGGLVIVIAGLLFIAAPLPPDPPSPAAGATGEVKAGWYPLGRRSDVIAYWNGTRWTHRRHLQ